MRVVPYGLGIFLSTTAFRRRFLHLGEGHLVGTSQLTFHQRGALLSGVRPMLAPTISADFPLSATMAMYSVPYRPSATPSVRLRLRLIRLGGVINLTWDYPRFIFNPRGLLPYSPTSSPFRLPPLRDLRCECRGHRVAHNAAAPIARKFVTRAVPVQCRIHRFRPVGTLPELAHGPPGPMPLCGCV